MLHHFMFRPRSMSWRQISLPSQISISRSSVTSICWKKMNPEPSSSRISRLRAKAIQNIAREFVDTRVDGMLFVDNFAPEYLFQFIVHASPSLSKKAFIRSKASRVIRSTSSGSYASSKSTTNFGPSALREEKCLAIFVSPS